MSTLPAPALAAAQPPRLLDLVRQVARQRFGQDGPADRCAGWTRRLVLFHDKRHPRDLSPGDVGRFLEHVAQTEKNPSTAWKKPTPPSPSSTTTCSPSTWANCPSPTRRACSTAFAVPVASATSPPRTEHCYAAWAERFIRFHGLRHSADCRIMPIEPPGPLFSCAFGFSSVVGEAA